MKERIWGTNIRRESAKAQIMQQSGDEPTSMKGLASWNISKALDVNPDIDLKSAIPEVKDRLEEQTPPSTHLLPESPSRRHLACAVMAWQQEGYQDVDGLIKIAEQVQTLKRASHSNQTTTLTKDDTLPTDKSMTSNRDDTSPLGSDYLVTELPVAENRPSGSVFTSKYAKYGYAGPVVALPAHTNCCSRVTTERQQRPSCSTKDCTKKKIDMACCLESGCAKVLSRAEASTSELRARITRLMTRERERRELLERAELAWKQLELSYQRRLKFAEEKEKEVTGQINKMIEQRQAFKEASTGLCEKLKAISEDAEKSRSHLNDMETVVCEVACERHQLSEESAKLDAALVNEQIKMTQLERDLQFKEEQARHTLASVEGQADSARMFTLEAQHATRGELSDVTGQVNEVKKQIKSEDELMEKELKKKLAALKAEKDTYIDQLENCSMSCDKRVKKQAEEIRTLRENLGEINEKMMECRCKIPVDEAVQVKRTPSLAVLCQCKPEDRFVESCSCTSLRTKLLSDFLADLFGGLHSEMRDAGGRLPCQMLKCLDDRQNLDHSSQLKSKLSSYFSNLLVNELDIAIATSIEKYHAKWVGMSCADTLKRGSSSTELEKRAEHLALQIAQKVIKGYAHEIRTPKDRGQQGSPTPPPPPGCREHCPHDTAKQTQNTLYITELSRTAKSTTQEQKSSRGSQVRYSHSSQHSWRGLHDEVTNLRARIETLNQETKNRTNILTINNPFQNMVDQATVTEKSVSKTSTKEGKPSSPKESIVSKTKVNRASNFSKFSNISQNNNKSTAYKKRLLSPKKISRNNGTQYEKPIRSCVKKVTGHIYPFKIMRQTYDVNLCLCGEVDEKPKENKSLNAPLLGDTIQSKPTKDVLLDVVNLTQTSLEPQTLQPQGLLNNNELVFSENTFCPYAKFNEIHSGTSIEKFFKSLAQFKCNLNAVNSAKNSKEQTCCDMKKASYEKEDNLFIHDNRDNLIKSKDKSPKKYSNELLRQEMPASLNKDKTENVIAAATSKLQSINGLTNSLNKSNASFCFETQSYVSDNNNIPNKNHNVNSNGEIENHQGLSNKVSQTGSEYMGAVNLEKGYDYSCRCINKPKDRKCKTLKRKYGSKYGLKCINSDICKCQFLGRKEKNKIISIRNIGDLVNYESQTEDKYFNDLNIVLPQRIVGNNKIFEKEQLLKNNQRKQEKLSETTIKDIIKHSESFPQSSDYDVLFLGVTLNSNTPEWEKPLYKSTLDKANSDKAKPNSQIRVQKDEIIEGNKNIVNTDKKSSSRILEYGDREKKQNLQCYQSKMNNEEKTVKQSDKALDIQSLKTSFAVLKPDTCVCCRPTQESRELEVNTFELLKQHLTVRLNEFQKSTCKSSCIPHQQQEELCSAILQKVKEIISDSTNKMTCKCMGSEQSNGSWTRAYALLQEYLKTKFNRVQCFCAADTNIKDYNILPEVLDKVNLLIEKDFNRLKDLCHCNRIKEDLIKTTETPERDSIAVDMHKIKFGKNLSFGVNTNEVFVSSKQVSNDSLFLTQNISCQVSKKSMDNKYCEYIYMHETGSNLGSIQSNCEETKVDSNIEEVESIHALKRNLPPGVREQFYPRPNLTVNIKSLQVLKDNQNPVLHKPGALSTELEQSNNLPQVVGSAEIISNDKIDFHLQDKKNTSPNSPLIGSTVHCSCDIFLGPCVCSKAIVKGNQKEIKEMWNRFTAGSKDQAEKNSYIMDNTKINKITAINDKTDKKRVDKSVDSMLASRDITLLREQFKDLTNHDKEAQSDKVYNNVKINNSTNMLIQDLYQSCPAKDTTMLDLESALPFTQTHALCEKNIASVFPVEFGSPGMESSQSDHSSDFMSTGESQDPNCDCHMVPVCHVKMLVDNIEHKLVNSICTCDTLDQSVCPEHSKMN